MISFPTSRHALALLASAGLALAPLPAQEPTEKVVASAAAEAMRQGWWAETGANELEKAVALYRQAADAEGPARIRAEALVRAGLVLHRLGRLDEALASLDRVVGEFAEEATVVAMAQQHRRDLTAVDLVENYSAWYRQMMFSEATQREILTQFRYIVGMSDNRRPTHPDVVAEYATLAAYGPAVVPAMREFSRSRSAPTAEVAMLVLERLGELPPPDAMIANTYWARGIHAWVQLQSTTVHERRKLLLGFGDQRTPIAGLALMSIADAVAWMGSESGVELAGHEDEIEAYQLAVLGHGPADLAAAVAALSYTEEAPLFVRRIAETAVIDSGWPTASAADWMRFSSLAMTAPAKLGGLSRALSCARSGDGEVFDEVLAAPSMVPSLLREACIYAVLEGFLGNRAVLSLPWTPERMAFTLSLASSMDSEIGEMLVQFHETARGRQILLDGLWHDLVGIVQAAQAEDATSSLEDFVNWADAELEAQVLSEFAWAATVRDRVLQEWGSLDASQRHAVVTLLDAGLICEGLEPTDHLREFLRSQLAAGVGDDALAAALKVYLEPS